MTSTIALTGCSSTGNPDPNTITYWASNQGVSLQQDREVLAPRLAEFTRQTGIKVNLEVIDWGHLLNRLTMASVSGEGPDVVNIGNTWAASTQAIGGFVEFDEATFDAIGGADKFLPSSMRSTGAAGQVPASVPLYGMTYGLFYNKKSFAAAGIDGPPDTWAELIADARKLTNPAANSYGVTLIGGSNAENAKNAFIGSEQLGGSFFDGAGRPTFDTPANVQAVKRYLDLLGVHKVAVPSSADHLDGGSVAADFASGRAAMAFLQGTSVNQIEGFGMRPEDYGVARLPVEAPLPPGGRPVASHVGGINIAVFKDKNVSASLKFVKFMTDRPAQVALNKAFTSLPVTPDAAADPAFQDPKTKTFLDVLRDNAAAMPMVANESQFEAAVGSAMKNLIGQAVAGRSIDEAQVRAALDAAQQTLGDSG